jgi:DNA-cytosine methyltransferase
MQKIKILSLFDGISIAQQAFKELGYEVEYYASEIDKYAIQITQKNFPNTIQLGDIKILTNELENIERKWSENIDLIVGGSPCQDLSIANKNRQGLDGARSGLFWEYVRILKEVKPKYFVLENVNSMPKEAKAIITDTLWGIEPVMINAALVSAQNRKRLFWVGKLVGDTYEQVAIDQPQDKGILLKDILESEVDEKYYLSDKLITNFTTREQRKSFPFKPMEKTQEKTPTLTARYFKMAATDPYVKDPIRIGSLNSGGQGDRIYSPEGKSVNLSANGGGRGAKTGLYAVGCASRTYPRIKVDGEEKNKQIEIRDDEKANSMTSVQSDSMVQEQSQIRKLTPIECERLQSLPDNYTEGISNTQRYKALGNGFNCSVIKHILENILCLAN